MYYYDSAYLGMHFFWWCFWLVLWVIFFSLLTPVPRRQWQRLRETPKEILMRRLASGEISEQEYAASKAVIEQEIREDSRDARTGRLFPLESQGI